MQVDLVDQDDCLGFGRRVHESGVGLRQSTGQIEHQRQRPTLSIGELADGDGRRAPVDQEPRAIRALEPQVRVAGKKARNRVLDGTQHAACRRALAAHRFLHLHPGGELLEPQLPVGGEEHRERPTAGLGSSERRRCFAKELRLLLLRSARRARLVDEVGEVLGTNPDIALDREGLSTDPDIVQVERLDSAAQFVHALHHRREANAERIQHARLADAVDADDEIDARLEAELGRLDGAEVGKLEARDDHAALPM